MTEWIKCSERMPEMKPVPDESMIESDFVLCYSPMQLESQMIVLRLSDSELMGLNWTDDDDIYWPVGQPRGNWPDMPVTHWMPLPAPPGDITAPGTSP